MSEQARRRVVVRGNVQGVFFRDSCRQKARSRGVAGWVTNRPDGAVEAVFEGDAGAVQAMVDWCGQGPRGADVTSVDESTEEPEGLSGFDIR
jgi:acylphosphatase